ncbi:hypothetical protein TNCV_1306521 [Trichonephila clavipes]|nr:hypothetical protein TNCV_1306521 [Trichonephila clavipes]
MVPLPTSPSRPTETRGNSSTITPKENRNKNSLKTVESENFGFMDAILELKIFTDYPSLLELGRQLRNAQGNERISTWNANGIKSRIVEVRDFIDKHHPDVFLIQEFHLGPGDTIHIPNYTVYRNDRPRTTSNPSRGGTVILLKSSLPTTTHDIADGAGGKRPGHSPARRRPTSHHFAVSHPA